VFARLPCAEFEVRNEGQKHNIIVISKFFLFLFDSNYVNAKLFSEVTVTDDGGNNSGVQRGVGGGTSNAVAIFPVFPKNKAFFCLFRSNFLLKNAFLNDCKVRY